MKVRAAVWCGFAVVLLAVLASGGGDSDVWAQSTVEPSMLTGYANATAKAQITPIGRDATPEPTYDEANSQTGRIAFTSERTGNREIFTINPDGSDLRRLTGNPADDVYPSWSPDGSLIVFESQRGITPTLYIMNADGSNIRRLLDTDTVDGMPDWSPDGSRIVFASWRETQSEIYVINADGTDLRRLTNDRYADEVPVWSPDGSQIAFAKRRSGSYEIYTMDADGRNPRRIDTDLFNTYDPVWSPDGTKIAFTGFESVNRYAVYVMNADGSGIERLTESPSRSPRWSPDGSQIVYQRFRDGAHDLFIMDANGNNSRALVENPGADFSPAWR
jgi:Tol biopolymer transport system component